jgi:predicted nucleotidyltransferase
MLEFFKGSSPRRLSEAAPARIAESIFSSRSIARNTGAVEASTYTVARAAYVLLCGVTHLEKKAFRMCKNAN